MREKEDERNLQITLTESGINIKPTLKAISDQVFEDFDISQDEKDNLVNSLNMLFQITSIILLTNI